MAALALLKALNVLGASIAGRFKAASLLSGPSLSQNAQQLLLSQKGKLFRTVSEDSSQRLRAVREAWVSGRRGNLGKSLHVAWSPVRTA